MIFGFKQPIIFNLSVIRETPNFYFYKLTLSNKKKNFYSFLFFLKLLNIACEELDFHRVVFLFSIKSVTKREREKIFFIKDNSKGC